MNKVPHPSLNTSSHLSKHHFQSFVGFFKDTYLWILPVLVLHQKYFCSVQHWCFNSRWFEGGNEADAGLCKVKEGEEEHRAQPLQPPQLPSHLVQTWWDKEKPLFHWAFPLITSALMESCKSFVCTETGFLKENLRSPQWVHPADCKHHIVRSTNVPTTIPSNTLSKDFKHYEGHSTWAPIKYLPELRLRLLQNLRRTENCLRGGTWKQRGHFSEYGLTGWKTKPHFSPTLS